MSTVAKVLVVLNFLLAALFLGSASALVGHSDHWKGRHATDTKKLETELAASKAREKAKDEEIERVQADARAANDAANANRQENETLKTQNKAVREAHESLLASHAASTRALQIAQSTIDNTQNLVKTLQDSRKADIDNLTRALDEKNAAVKMQNALEANLQDLSAQKKDLDAKLSETSETLRTTAFALEAYKKAYPGGPGTEQPHQVAKVLTADAANNLVVISLGSEDGVQAGYRYAVSRGNTFVGTITIISTQAKMAAGKVTLKGNGTPMPGDDVSTSSTR